MYTRGGILGRRQGASWRRAQRAHYMKGGGLVGFIRTPVDAMKAARPKLASGKFVVMAEKIITN